MAQGVTERNLLASLQRSTMITEPISIYPDQKSIVPSVVVHFVTLYSVAVTKEQMIWVHV